MSFRAGSLPTTSRLCKVIPLLALTLRSHKAAASLWPPVHQQLRPCCLQFSAHGRSFIYLEPFFKSIKIMVNCLPLGCR